jgi:hypothetical protein
VAGAGMFYTLGLNCSKTYNQEAIGAMLPQLDAQFHLVLIYEKLEESLILLKDLLCLHDSEISTNVELGRNKNLATDITEEDKEFLHNVLDQEYVLYNFFRRKLEWP